MFIAQQKKQENIAEYLLYLWQLEDLMRACQLSIEQVNERLVAPTNHTDEEKQQALQWYDNFIATMRVDGVQKEGHLQVNINLLNDLNSLHLQILREANDAQYNAVYYQTLPFIVELRAKTAGREVPEMETCFTALYGYMLLKLQRKPISAQTQAAVEQISKLVRLLAERYHKREKEEETI